MTRQSHLRPDFRITSSVPIVRAFRARSIAWACLLALAFTVYSGEVGAVDASLAAASHSCPSPMLACSAVTKVVVVTDDDFLSTSASPWCGSSLAKVIRACRDLRPRTSLQIRSVFAGAPRIMFQNRPKVGPRRALLFFCDEADRVFAFCVGMTNAEQFLTLLEQADEQSIVTELGKHREPEGSTDENEAAKEVAGIQSLRTAIQSRTIRHYRPLLDSIQHDVNIVLAAERLNPALQKDLAERFLLSLPIENGRLAAVQQHAEACRYWCDAMLPCVTGKTVDQVWPELATVVWGAQPWRVELSDLHHWYDQVLPQGPVALEVLHETPFVDCIAVQPNHLVSNAASDVLERRETRQRTQIEESLAGVEHRAVNFAELAAILSKGKEKSIDWFHDSNPPPKWVLLDAQHAKAQFFYQESEGRFIDALKRIQARCIR